MRLLLLLFLAAASLPAQPGVPTVTRRLTIGCESCGGPQQFGNIWGVSVSPRGEVLVTDRDPPMLRYFDAGGKSLWTAGVKGKGPGELALPIRADITGAGIVVVDMTNSRITDFTPGGALAGTVPVRSMPMAASTNARGDVWVGSDNFRGTLRLLHRSGVDSLRERLTVQGSSPNFALAVSPDGAVAVQFDVKKYEIVRFDAGGKPLPAITRDVAPVRRTQAEEAELRERLGRVRGMASAEARASGRARPAPSFRQDELSLKDPLTVDGLRYDGAGRLWVLTQRGNESSTVFDVFSPSGSYLGMVTLPLKVWGGFSLSGSHLVTGSENEDGIPVVTVWTVK